MKEGTGWRYGLAAKAAACAMLVAVAEAAVDGDDLGAIVGLFALFWTALALMMRPALGRLKAARIALGAAGLFALVLIDDPSIIAWILFWTALSLAAMLPRHRFDDALAWGVRLAWHGAEGMVSPVRDAARLAAVRRRRQASVGAMQGVFAAIAVPIVGGSVFLALFANANPLIGDLLVRIAPPDFGTIIWRALLAMIVAAVGWAVFRPSTRATRWRFDCRQRFGAALEPGVATLLLSLGTFNAIFAVQNALDIAFLWSGAPLPRAVTMADYAHRGAYSLIVTALLAAAFVLVALRPGNRGAGNRMVRRLVTLWIAQNVLLVASSVLRTLDYVDAYGMTILRLSALAWMALVGWGLLAIGWRLLRGRSAAWLINANALAATLVLTLASMIDLGASAAAWNARTALTRERAGPPLDLCYMASLGPSSLISLARLERHATSPTLRDAIASLRLDAQYDLAARQAAWRSWTPRGARRLAEARALTGPRDPILRQAPDGRACDGSIERPQHDEASRLPLPPPPAVPPIPLTQGTER